MVVGAVITVFSQHPIHFVFTTILAEIIALPYLIIKAFDNPQKREEKKQAKLESTIQILRKNRTNA